MEGDHYTPSQAARVLSRSGRKITERRIRQMLQAGELEGERTASGRWRIPQSVVHEILEQRRELERLSEDPERPPGAPESGREYLERVERKALQRELGRLEGRLELTEQAESTLREQLQRERERADRLEAELERERRRGFWSRLFGG